MGHDVVIGRVLRAHGIRGEVVVERFGETPGLLDPDRIVRLRRAGAVVAMTVTANRMGPRGRRLVRFAGVEDRDAAEALRGGEILVDERELPRLAEGEYYNFQVIGMEAVTPDGELLGRVEEIWDTGASDVFVVRGSRGEILIPAVAEMVRELDWDRGRVVVTPIPGLLPEEW